MFKPNSLINYIESEIKKEFPNKNINYDLLYLLNTDELLNALYMLMKIGSSDLDKNIKFQVFQLFALDPREFLNNKKEILKDCFNLKTKDINVLNALTAVINNVV